MVIVIRLFDPDTVHEQDTSLGYDMGWPGEGSETTSPSDPIFMYLPPHCPVYNMIV